MKLEEGMYLRHSGLEGEYPIIQKIIKLETPGRCGGKYKVYTDKCENWFIDSDYIELDKSKYSHNIIDLIEVGDYVNGYKVYEVIHDVKSYVVLEDVGCYVETSETIDEEDIKSIVTKEQFESMQYKVD